MSSPTEAPAGLARERGSDGRGQIYLVRFGDRFPLTFDNHDSVNGIREFARAKGATAAYVPMRLPEIARRRTTTWPRH